VAAGVTRTGGLDPLSARGVVIPFTLRFMIEEEESTEAPGPGNVTPDDMAAALQAVRASSPELSQAIDAAGVTPDGLVDAHDAATGGADEDGSE
jgi:hypothetical protein